MIPWGLFARFMEWIVKLDWGYFLISLLYEKEGVLYKEKELDLNSNRGLDRFLSVFNLRYLLIHVSPYRVDG